MKRFLFILFGLLAWWLAPMETFGQSNSSAITYSCWFDEDYTAIQTGILTGNQFVLDVDAITPGFHSLNIQFGTDSNAQLQRFLFFCIATIPDTTHATTYSTWYDEDYTTLQSGIIGNGMLLLDVADISEGFHSLNVQFGTGDRAQLTRYYFFKVATILDTTRATTYSYWFDEDYSTLRSGNIGNGVLMLDVADVSSGFHSLNIQFGTGDRAQITRYMFFKTETSPTEPTTSITYTCWFDQDYEHRQTGTLVDGMFLLDVSMLSDSNHTLFVQMGEGENAQLTSHRLYSKEVHEIIYSHNIPHGSISVTSLTDTIFEGHFVFDSATVLIFATPGPLYILEHLIVNGDTVQSPYSLLVTQDVTIEASFARPLPDLHVTQVSNGIPISGRTMQVTYTVANHGLASTPIGAAWYDSIYIVQNAEVRMFDPEDQHGFLLAVPNMQALDTGESYTQTVNVTIPPDIVGSYYLFVLTDMADAYAIDYTETNDVTPDQYTPSVTGNPYHFLKGQTHRPGGRIAEIEENDNFFFKRITITAPPAADLTVTNITIPTTFYSGTTVNAIATIGNQGQNATTSYGWLDALYCSRSDHFDSTATRITTLYHDALANTALQVGATYQDTFSFQVPLTWFGETYFYVMADASNSEYEYAGEQNNMRRSSLVNVILTPPADLIVSRVDVPMTISNSERFTVSYKVLNAGLGKSNHDEWYNNIYLSTSPNLPAVLFDNNGHSPLYSYDTIPDSVDWCYLLESDRQYRWNGIEAGASITTDRNYNLPAFINKTTQLYVIVVADVNNNVFEYNREDNNVGHSSVTQAIIYFPDFSLSNLQAPDTMVAQHTIDVSFDIHNYGLRNYNGDLNYRLYYSADSVFDETNATLLTDSWRYTSSLLSRPQTLGLQVQFPNTIVDSNYYLYLFVNPDSTVAEYTLQNNMLRRGTYYICHRTLPDLVLCNVTLPDTLQASGVATLTFDVVNNGEVNDERPAHIYGISCHTVLVADDSLWCPVQSQASPAPIGRMTLAVGDTLHYAQTVKIPPMAQGSVTFSLAVDANNRIMELDETNNRMSFTRQVHPLSFDLALQDIDAPESYTTGDTVAISWVSSITGRIQFYHDTIFDTVDVTGYSHQIRWKKDTTGTLWNNILVLSSDSVYSADDRVLDWKSVQSFSSGDTIVDSVKVIMPHTLSGNLYLIAVADVYQNCIESTRANNTFIRPISATLAPQPNLVVTALTMDDTVYQKQGCMIHYTVTNQGEGSAATSIWSDEFSIGETQVKKVSRIQSLTPGESYSDSVEIVIPDGLLGVYSLRMKTDADNGVFESTNEEDNTMSRPVIVLPALPCDLVVASVSTDATVTVGSHISVNYVTQNIGVNAVRGYVKDAIYLSTDTIYDEDDVLLGTIAYRDTLPAHGLRQHSISSVVQNGLTEGTYYVIVRTNIMRAFNEVSFDNNKGVSTSPVSVTLPILTIGQEEQFYMYSGNKKYYRLDVGPEHVGKTLSVSLNSNVISSIDSELQRGLMSYQNYYPSDAFLNSHYNQYHQGAISVSTYKDRLYVKIKGKYIFVGYKYIHVGYHWCPCGPCPPGRVCGCVISLCPLSLSITYEPLVIPIYILVEHQLYSVNVSASCYNEIFGNSELTTLNDNQSQLNCLYVSHEGMPTPTTCEYSVGNPNDTSQYLTIPSLQQGSYYFMINASSSGGLLYGVRKQITISDYTCTGYRLDRNVNSVSNIPSDRGYLYFLGRHVVRNEIKIPQLFGDDRDIVYYMLPRTNSNEQTMRLLAKTVDFEIVDVNTSEGSNQGSVTTKVTGALFDNVMDFRLENGDVMIPPTAVQRINPSEAYVTFELNGAEEGTYDMVAELPGGIITTKEGAFVIGDRLPSELSVNIVAPSKVRVGQVTGINIEYSNTGASNLNVVGLLVRPSKGTYISPTANPDAWVNGDIFIRFPQVGGPIYGGVMIPWSNQNQAPAVKDVKIPSVSSTPVNTTSSSSSNNSSNSSSSSGNVFYGGVYQTIRPGNSGSYELYTRPGFAGRGTLDVYPVYKIAATR